VTPGVDRSRVPQPGSVPAVRFPAVRAVTLTNGLAMRTVEHPGQPVVTFLLTMPAGSASDPAGQSGLAALTADLLDEGSDERTALDLHTALERIGARLGIEVGSDATKVSLTTLSRSAAEGLALLAEIVARPRFDETDVARVRDMRRSRVRQLRAVPGAVADRVFLETLFPDHPYGHLGIGTDDSLAGLTAAHVRQFHRDVFQLGTATLIAVGALTHDRLIDAAERAFGDVPVRSTTDTVVVDPAGLAAPGPPLARLVLVDRPGAVQSELRVGHVAVARSAPDYHALQVLNMVLGGQFVSRLNLSLREEKGYTYGVRTAFDCRRAPGPFAMQGSVQSGATVEAVQEVFEQIEAIRGDRPVTPAELDMARAALTRGFPRGFETASQVARGLGRLVLHGLPEDYYDRFVPHVEAVDASAVTAAATAHLHADRAVAVIVGPAEQIAPGLAALDLGEPERVEINP
jgi:zinc protease